MNLQEEGLIMGSVKDCIKYILNFAGFVFHHNRRSKIVYYHDVGVQYTKMGTPLKIIDEQINEMRACGFEIVPHLTCHNNQVMIAFDDGWKGLYDEKDYFIAKGIRPTIFIAVDLIGKDGYMTIDEIRQLQDKGFIFESHTWSHKGLPDFKTDTDLKHELVDSKNQLEVLLNTEITSLCFPQGRFSSKVIEMSQKAGYKDLYSSIPGGAYDLEKDGILCRNLFAEVPVNQVKFVLEGVSFLFRSKLIKEHISK